MSEAARVNVVARTTENQFFLKEMATFSQANEQPNAMHKGGGVRRTPERERERKRAR